MGGQKYMQGQKLLSLLPLGYSFDRHEEYSSCHLALPCITTP